MSNPIACKSLDFAVRIVKLSQLVRERKEFELAKQLVRSGTSIGANVAEAQRAQSDKDFLSKMYIAAKEANETEYWLILLNRAEVLDDKEFKSIYADLKEIIRILMSITKSLETKLKQRC